MKSLFLIAHTLRFLVDYGTPPVQKEDWHVAWEDNFSFLDPAIWNVANCAVHVPEEQIFIPDNVRCKDGTLRIKLAKESYTCPPNPQQTIWSCQLAAPGTTYPYTSGWIETNAAHDTRFGYIEARIKFPHGSGFWPAFWTWRGASGETSNEVEIDMVEILGRMPSDVITTNYHMIYPDSHYEEIRPKDFDYTEFHTYGMWWTKDHFVWYIDGVAVRYEENPGLVENARIIFGIGMEPGVKPAKRKRFPAFMQVDYLKIYKPNNS